jgi:hypothetical protein
MAELRIEAGELVVELSELEKIGALHGDLRMSLTAVSDVRVAEDPRPELRGLRAPGTGIPGVIALGSRRGEGHDFAAAYHNRPAVVVDLDGAEFDRLVITVPDPESAAAAVRAAAAEASGRAGG